MLPAARRSVGLQWTAIRWRQSSPPLAGCEPRWNAYVPPSKSVRTITTAPRRTRRTGGPASAKATAVRVLRVLCGSSLAPPRTRAAQRIEIAQKIVEIAIVQPIGPIHRHHRLLLLDDVGQVRLQIPLHPLPHVHDLDREFVFVLSHAANALAIARHQRHRLVAGPDHVAGAAKLVRQCRARPTRTDPRQVGTQLAALAANRVAAQAIGAKDLLAVCGVPGRYHR